MREVSNLLLLLFAKPPVFWATFARSTQNLAAQVMPLRLSFSKGCEIAGPSLALRIEGFRGLGLRGLRVFRV